MFTQASNAVRHALVHLLEAPVRCQLFELALVQRALAGGAVDLHIIALTAKGSWATGVNQVIDLDRLGTTEVHVELVRDCGEVEARLFEDGLEILVADDGAGIVVGLEAVGADIAPEGSDNNGFGSQGEIKNTGKRIGKKVALGATIDVELKAGEGWLAGEALDLEAIDGAE